MNLWPSSSTASLQGSSTTLSSASSSVASGVSDSVTITVAGISSTTKPTGTLSISVDGSTPNSSLALAGGAATYSFSSTTSGSHTIVATYSGDSVYASSTGSAIITIGNTSSSSTGSFSISAENITVSDGSSGTSTVTVTPSDGYTGTVNWTLSSPSSLSNACYQIPSVTVSNSSATSTTLTIYTSSSSCSGSQSPGAKGRRLIAATTRSGVGESLSLAAAWSAAWTLGLAIFRRNGRRCIPLSAFDGTCAGLLHGGVVRMRKQWNKYHFFKCTQRKLYPDNHRHGCPKFFYQIVR
ncbi:MAG: Ig-like domain-containing protein [Edaphobacter sp.]